jgi:hypothetical protein
MSSLRPQDRASLCRFVFADGRRCRVPRSPYHPHFCSDHARKESQAAPPTPFPSPAPTPLESTRRGIPVCVDSKPLT